MPNLNVSDFEKQPSVGDKIRVEGEIKSIDTGTGEVEASYDSIKILNKKRSSDEGESSSEENSPETSMDLDQALEKNFNYTR